MDMSIEVETDPTVAIWRQIFHDAHTTNTFVDEPVDPALVREVYEAVRWAPTAMNAQPMRLAIIASAEARARLAPHMSEGNRAKTLAAPLTVVVAYDPAFHEHLELLAPHRAGAREKLADQPDFRDGFARTNALIQLGYLLLGLRGAGLSVGPMTGMDAAGINAELFTESGWQALAVVNLGHGAGDEPDAVRPRAGRLDADAATVTC